LKKTQAEGSGSGIPAAERGRVDPSPWATGRGETAGPEAAVLRATGYLRQQPPVQLMPRRGVSSLFFSVNLRI
jgi:hypothetical protein